MRKIHTQKRGKNKKKEGEYEDFFFKGGEGEVLLSSFFLIRSVCTAVVTTKERRHTKLTKKKTATN